MHRYLRRIYHKILPSLLLTALFIGNGYLAGNITAQTTDPKELFQVCAACHHIGKGKLIGPDLYGVTERLDREWLIRFIRNSQEVIESGDEYAVKLVEEYNNIPMPPVDYTDEQINILIDYIANFDPDQPAAPAVAIVETEAVDDFFAETQTARRNYGAIFIISLILLLAAAFDLLVTRLIKARFVNAIVMLISAFVMIEITVVEAQNLGRQKDYEPDQPILFSHKIHAGENRIDCKYCHTSVTESKHAGIPPVSLCMNCHNVIREGRHTGRTEIDKIYQALETGRPIQWVRVHNLPDHSFFNHAQHVNIGKMECESCHGDVASMHRIRQVHDLSMGWCIECHRNTEVHFLDNNYYEKFRKFHEELKAGTRTRVTVDDVGGTECSKCHY